jgi:sortase A
MVPESLASETITIEEIRRSRSQADAGLRHAGRTLEEVRGSVLRRSGIALCALGGLLLAFVAFQLWGTSVSEHSAQARLTHELDAQLHRSHSSTTSAPPTTHASGDNPTLQAPTPVDPTSQPAIGAPVGFLSIPRIGMNDDAIVQGVDTDQLREGPGHYPGTPLPGQAGNVAIAGHRTTYAAPFYNLNELQPGDPIVIQTVQGTFRYAVTQTNTVAPTDSAVLDNSPTAELTLTTCNPRYSASHRLIVVAVLQSSQPSAAAHRTTGTGHHRPTAKATKSPLTLAYASSDGITGAVLWGVATALIAGLIFFVWRRWRRPLPRWAAALVGVPGALAALFVFFGHVSTLLPASF